MKNSMLLAQIMQKAGALGDASLVGLLGELMEEISSNDSVQEPKGTEGGKYVFCVEATMANGAKVQHPVIGGMSIPTSIEDYKMMSSSNLITIQQESDVMASMIKSAFPNIKTRIVNVSDEAYESLEKKLNVLITSLNEMIDKAAEAKAEAYGMMNVEIDESDISNEMIADVMRKTIYAGACINSDGEVVDRCEEKYLEEDEIDARKNSYEEDDDDDDEDEDEDEEPEYYNGSYLCNGCCAKCEGEDECENAYEPCEDCEEDCKNN